MLSQLSRYEIVRQLGGGGMGDVYLAHRRGVGGFSRPLALKVMRPDLAATPRAMELFLREGAVLAALRHRNIVQVFELDQDAGQLYLAMEYLEGVNLRRLVTAHGGRLPAPAVAWIAREVARGLSHAHRAELPGAPNGVIHRDLSPSNVMACSDGAVKILDFGLARPAGETPSVSGVEGKLVYLAPECVAGVPLDGRADVYALGVIMYELLAGAQPFEGEGPLGLMQAITSGTAIPLARRDVAVPVGLADLVERAMARDLGTRLASARALEDALGPYTGTFDADELRRLVRGAQHVTATTTESEARVTRPATSSRRRSGLVAGVLVAAVLAATAITVAVTRRGDRGEAPARHVMPEVASPAARGPAARAPAEGDDAPGGSPASAAVPPRGEATSSDDAPIARSDASGPARTRTVPSRSRAKTSGKRAAPAHPERQEQPSRASSDAPPKGAPPGTLLDPFGR